MRYEAIRSALFAIPPDDREVWFRMASALKRELGETEGFALWDEWSRQWPRYRESHARRTWRSAGNERSRPVTIGSLFYIARQWCWNGEIPAGEGLRGRNRDEFEAEQKRERERIVRRQRRAATQAASMLQASTRMTHDYLSGKGFSDVYMQVLGKRLLVPMRDVEDGRLWSIQSIWPNGEKRYLSGGRAGGMVHRIGVGEGARWFCEGIATALSVHAAVRQMGRIEDVVVVCFAAANVEAATVRRGRAGDMVVADRDRFRCAARGCDAAWEDDWGNERQCPVCGSRWVVDPPGERYARRSNLPYWLPPKAGDANDFMRSEGLDALSDALGQFASAI